MKVERIMAVMRGADGTHGYIKVDKIGDRVVLSADMTSEDNILSLRINMSNIFTYKVSEVTAPFILSMTTDCLSNIECIEIDKDSETIVSSGSNTIYCDADILMKEYEASKQWKVNNSDTYIGDSVESSSITNTSNELQVEPIGEDIEAISKEDMEDTEEANDKASSKERDSITLGTSGIYSEKSPFYDAISSQLEDLYTRYEREEVLENVIKGSRFARIYYDEDNYYVVGEIRDEENKPMLVCYGYPGEGGTQPPKEVENSYEWLPLDKSNVHGKGYYMMYQNATSGEVLSN